MMNQKERGGTGLAGDIIGNLDKTELTESTVMHSGKVALTDDELENVSGGGLANRRFRNMTPEQFLALSPEEKGQYYEWLQKRKGNRKAGNDLPAWLQNFGK